MVQLARTHSFCGFESEFVCRKTLISRAEISGGIGLTYWLDFTARIEAPAAASCFVLYSSFWRSR
jgi:hypothetical protein